MEAKEFFKELHRLEAKFESAKPELEVTVRDPENSVEGYVVVWNTKIAASGPLGACGKGGTRITPQTNLDEIKMLAKTMALKNAAAGLPLGGAKSGIKADSKEAGFEVNYRKFVQLCRPLLKENGGIFGGFGFDIGADPIHALWACDELKSTKSFTGKPVEMGGTDYDREGIAGLGVAVAARTLLAEKAENINSSTAAVQGLGAMGGAVVRYFSEFGGKVTHIADPRIGGAHYFPEGLPKDIIESITKNDFSKTKELLEKANTKAGDIDSILFKQVDVLFPCAVQNVVDVNNCANIKSRYLVEGANNPCSKAAQEALFEQGTLVIPDFIANPGGIIAAFVELTSNATPEENIKTRINVIKAKELTENRITENVKNILEHSSSIKVAPIHSAKYLALKRIFG